MAPLDRRQLTRRTRRAAAWRLGRFAVDTKLGTAAHVHSLSGVNDLHIGSDAATIDYVQEAAAEAPAVDDVETQSPQQQPSPCAPPAKPAASGYRYAEVIMHGCAWMV